MWHLPFHKADLRSRRKLWTNGQILGEGREMAPGRPFRVWTNAQSVAILARSVVVRSVFVGLTFAFVCRRRCSERTAGTLRMHVLISQA